MIVNHSVHYSEPSEAEEVLQNLTTTLKPHKISFKDVMKLMNKCDKLDENAGRALALTSRSPENLKAGNPLLIGIVPGNNLIENIAIIV